MSPDGDLWSDFALGFLAVAGLWAFCYALSYAVPSFDQKSGERLVSLSQVQRVDSADLLFSLVFFPVLSGMALAATFELRSDVRLRWSGVCWTSRWFQVLYVVRMVMHCPIQWVTLKDNPRLRLQMTIHHILSALCYLGSLGTGRMHFYATLDGCCEVTTCLLNGVFAFKFFSPRDDSKHWCAKALLGTFLWLGFVVFRLLLFPAWLWSFYSDVTQHPSESWDRITVAERFGYPMVTIFLLCVSLAWMTPITKGFFKVLGIQSKAKSRKVA